MIKNEKGPHAGDVGALYKSKAQSSHALGLAVFWRAVWKGRGRRFFGRAGGNTVADMVD